MNRDIAVAWAAGIFEGEGYIGVVNNRVIVVVEMTDRDILERLQEHFGGSLYDQKQRQANWKPTTKWQINNTKKAQEFLRLIFPYMGARRQSRCSEAFAVVTRSDKKAETVSKVIALRAEGMTHQAISAIIGCDRSYVSHILRKVNEISA